MQDFDQKVTEFQKSALNFMRSAQDFWAQANAPAAKLMPAMPNIMGTMQPMFNWLNGIAPLDEKALLEISKLQQEYVAEQVKLLQNAKEGKIDETVKPDHGDRRFHAKEWHDNSYYSFLYQSYLINSRYLRTLAEKYPATDEKAKQRLQFLARQTIDAASPSNFPALNPCYIKKALETEGKSIEEGIKNLVGDIKKGRISMTDESAFEVGKNVATTAGAVVYENEVMQLLQYTPLTEKVAKRPLLIVPPCINKFYIMDLQPENSLVRHAIESGHSVFLVSWRNPQEEQQHFTWDDYLENGPIKAIEVIQDITNESELNALAFCVGGTILTSALAVLADRGLKPVQSLTLMTTLLDFTDAGEIGLFIDEEALKKRELEIGKGGLLKGQELAGTFSALRANDLIWSYVVNNYLLGQQPVPFDLLYWNSDATNMPGPLAAWYMRHMYLQNELRVPGRLRMCGSKIDLRKVDIPVYIMAAREDHIVPWKSAYLSTQVLGSKVKRFVLGASGHIAGAINSAKKNKRSFCVNQQLAETADLWLEKAEEVPGSWWIDWANWLKDYHAGEVKAREKLGNKKYKEIEPAPGRYVKVKA